MEKRGDSGRKMKILCIHAFRSSGNILRKLISKWDPSIFAQHFDLEFPDGIFPAAEKAVIESIFPPPYFEWFQFNEDFTDYKNLEECISYLCEYMRSKGPFDGLLGYSQVIKQREHPPIKLAIIIAGSKFRGEAICDVAYKNPINVRSVHFIGDEDWLKGPSEELAAAFVNPLIINHPKGHIVPRLHEEAAEKFRNWTKEILDEAAAMDDVVVIKPHTSDNGELEPSLQLNQTDEVLSV